MFSKEQAGTANVWEFGPRTVAFCTFWAWKVTSPFGVLMAAMVLEGTTPCQRSVSTEILYTGEAHPPVRTSDIMRASPGWMYAVGFVKKASAPVDQ